MELITNIVSSDIITALGWTLVNVTWQGAIVGLSLWLFLKVFRQTSAKFKYAVSLLSLATIAGLVVFNFLNSYPNTILTPENPDLVISSGENSLFSISQIIAASQSSYTLNDIFITIANSIENYLPVIVNIWIVGIILFMLRFLLGYCYLNRVKSRNVSNLGEKWIEKFYVIESKLSIKKRIKYLESKVVKIPLVLGYLKPVIIIPAGMISGIPENQIEAIIAHELAHVKRNDFLINVIQIFIEILLFFHPAVWYISSVIRAERENCCDDLALTACEGSLTYAKALVSVQDLNPGKFYSAVAFAGQQKQLLNRIKRMIMKTEMKSNLSDRIIATLVVTVGLVIAALSISFTAESTETNSVLTNEIIFNHDISTAQKSESQVDPEIILDILKDTTKVISKNDHITIESKTIIRDFTDKDGKKKNIKFSLENGKVSEMYVDGKEIPKKDYPKYQSVVDETVEELKKAKIEIKHAMKEVQSIDTEKIKKEVEMAMKKLHIEMDSMNREIEKVVKEIKIVKVDSLMNDVQINIMNLERINFDSIMFEVQKSLKDVQILEKEEIKRQMEEARKHVESIDFEKIKKEIEANWEKTMKEVDTEAIRKEMDKIRKEMANIDWENMRIEIEKNIGSFDKEQTLKNMEKELQELEGLELEKK